MKTLFILLALLSLSCSEDDPKPCKELEQVCANLLEKSKQMQNPDEKERYYQLYLVEKQELENCLHGK